MEGRRAAILREIEGIEERVSRLREVMGRRWLLKPPQEGFEALGDVERSLEVIKHFLVEGDEGDVIRSLREIAEGHAQTNREVALRSIEGLGELRSEFRDFKSKLSSVVSAGERAERAAQSLVELSDELRGLIKGLDIEDVKRGVSDIRGLLEQLLENLKVLEREVRKLGSI